MYNRKAFKREAKERMRESTPHYMLVMLVYVLLTTGLSYAVAALTDLGGLLNGTLGMFLNILLSLFSMVLSVGLASYTLNLVRKKSTAVGDLFEGFSFAGRSIGMNLLVAVYGFLWSMLGIVGVGILAGVAIALEESVPALTVIVLVVAYIALLVFLVAVILRYSMARFALAENPEGGAGAAIRRSVQMMKGNKGKFFVLQLSFIGWGLLYVLIVLAVMAVGVLITGVDWFVGLVTSVGSDPVAAYNLTAEMSGHLTVWTIIAEVVCLPLTLWLTAYQQTTFARFYNYVCGYDYHQYMKGEPTDTQSGGYLPEGDPVEHSEPPTPPGGFYTPAPKLEGETGGEAEDVIQPEEVPEEVPAEEQAPVEEETSVECEEPEEV